MSKTPITKPAPPVCERPKCRQCGRALAPHYRTIYEDGREWGRVGRLVGVAR